jgi:hypothetical protein
MKDIKSKQENKLIIPRGENSVEIHRYQIPSRNITEKITLDTYNTKEKKQTTGKEKDGIRERKKEKEFRNLCRNTERN